MTLPHHRVRYRKTAVHQGIGGLGFGIWTSIALLALAALPAGAAVHPVPLDKNTDAAKCMECHDDKTKGKSVHSAMATGCLSCHEVRVNKDVTRVKLITATPSGLCLTWTRKRRTSRGRCILRRCAIASPATIRTRATTRISF